MNWRINQVSNIYLIRLRKPKVAHIWDGDDTLCRLASTGGLDKDRYKSSATPNNLKICKLCENKNKNGLKAGMKISWLGYNEVEVMAVAKGYAMLRRPHCLPFVMGVKSILTEYDFKVLND